MSTVEIILLGIALSMDAFAVTLSNAFAYRTIDKLHQILMPVFFGLFQGLMPVIGYFAGSFFYDFINQYAGIITFVILGFIGAKMIWDSLHEDEEGQTTSGTLTIPVLFFQAIATSIDALAVGVSFVALSVNIVFSASVIALTTFVCCVIALLINKHVGHKLGNKAGIVGGIILIAIGLKSLIF